MAVLPRLEAIATRWGQRGWCRESEGRTEVVDCGDGCELHHVNMRSVSVWCDALVLLTEDHGSELMKDPRSSRSLPSEERHDLRHHVNQASHIRKERLTMAPTAIMAKTAYNHEETCEVKWMTEVGGLSLMGP